MRLKKVKIAKQSHEHEVRGSKGYALEQEGRGGNQVNQLPVIGDQWEAEKDRGDRN